ncbi:hypothetical protein LBMAG42_04480 [Deltaproteobacteria bacterium]|nr:hypothetical protein LBMAG42_04480 [Deltaproteobacteria bacterium]
MRVTFEDLGRSFEAEPGGTLLDLAEREGVPMEAACGGFAGCNTCRVRLIAGALGPEDEAEAPFLDAPGQRLACQARIVADAVVRLDPGS